MRVLSATRRDLVEVVGECELEPVQRVVTRDPDRAEVRHIEDDGISTAGEVFVERAGLIGNGHLPPAEGHHLGAELAVDSVERAVLELGHQPARAGLAGVALPAASSSTSW